MKTFRLSLLFAAFALAEDAPTPSLDAPENDDDVSVAPVNITIDVSPPIDGSIIADEGLELVETDEEYWQKYYNFNRYGKDIWDGFFHGLYGTVSEYEPTVDCFGDWIVDKLVDLSEFKQELRRSWMVDMDRAAAASYDIVDLIFLNDRYCHFRKAIWDIKHFCAVEDNCKGGDILDHLQENAFSLITQVSSTVSAFRAEPWSEMDSKHTPKPQNPKTPKPHGMGRIFFRILQ